ncbi:unnamed protein product [Phyllotreta striolata]|uniref:Equilibrative nucleoside transporter n=1 Tax=Phyllotreta striolata TaxID=444603 RepID=A0A9N9U1T8_PHYSR|nr:unnamed protein product [Phyllotreta striolata]
MMLKAIPQVKGNYKINAWVFYVLGIMVMVPFHFYINSLDFWMYKLQSNEPRPQPQPKNYIPPSYRTHLFTPVIWDKPSAESEVIRITEAQWTGRNSNETTPPKERSPIQINFTSGVFITFKLSLLAALLICSVWSKRLPAPEKRIQWSLLALSVMFSINTVAMQINCTKMVAWYFAGMLVFASLMNFATGMAVASLYELLSGFSPTHYGFMQSGQNVCAIISSTLQVCLLSMRLRPDIHGCVYFVCGTFILIATTVYFFHIVRNSKCFTYTISQSEGEKKKRPRGEVTAPLSKLIWKIKWYYATFLFVNGTSHVVYPGLAVLVVPVNMDTGSAVWKHVYFVPVITFLSYGLFNLAGREITRIIKTPNNGLVLFVFAVMRIVLVPLLIFCNALPRRHLPVLFNDVEFICFLGVLAFSEGILINLTIVAMPTILDKKEREAVMVLIPFVTTVTTTLASIFNVLINNII